MFLDFVELIRTTGAHIAEAIMLSLAQNKIDILKYKLMMEQLLCLLKELECRQE